MSTLSVLKPRDTQYDGGIPETFGLIREHGALAISLHMFLQDCADLFARARQEEADGTHWMIPLVPGETPADEGRPASVLQDGTHATARSIGRYAWNKAKANGEIREARYVWVTEGVNLDTIAASVARCELLMRLASRIVRNGWMSGNTDEQALRTILAEIREEISEMMMQDPTLGAVSRESAPAYISDRVERMRQDGEGWHWGERPNSRRAH